MSIWNICVPVRLIRRCSPKSEIVMSSRSFSPRAVFINWDEADASYGTALVKDVDCHYLYVTTQWLFCVLEENGVQTLYRAENDPDNHRIGQLEPLVTDVIAQKGIAITDKYIYLWQNKPIGGLTIGNSLFRYRIDNTSNWVNRLFMSYDTSLFYVTEEYA